MIDLEEIAYETIHDLTDEQKEDLPSVIHDSQELTEQLLRELEHAVRDHELDPSTALIAMASGLELSEGQIDLAVILSRKDSPKDTIHLFVFWCAVLRSFINYEFPVSSIRVSKKNFH